MADANGDADVPEDDIKSPDSNQGDETQAESSETEANASSIDQGDGSYSPENVVLQSDSASDGEFSRTENVPSSASQLFDDGGLQHRPREQPNQQEYTERHSRHADPPPKLQRDTRGESYLLRLSGKLWVHSHFIFHVKHGKY